MRRITTLVVLGLLSTALAACGGSPRPSVMVQVPGSTTEVSFDAQGTTTYGTLEVPPHGGGLHVPAALLLPGSGPTDRDGNQAGGIQPDTLKVIAGILYHRGIATLRFDKYGTGRTGLGALAADPSSATIDSDLSMARSAYDFLARQKVVDPHQLLVVGHSEGGLIALSIATSDATKPAGLALLEPQDERILDLVRVQADEGIASLASSGTLTAAQARTNAADVARAVADFRAGRPVDTTGMDATVVSTFVAPILQVPSEQRYVTTWDALDPVTLASRVRAGTRVLVTDGTRDTNVPTSTIHPLVAALKGARTTGPGLVVVQGTDHLMHLASQPDTQPVLAPAEQAALLTWASAYHYT